MWPRTPDAFEGSKGNAGRRWSRQLSTAFSSCTASSSGAVKGSFCSVCALLVKSLKMNATGDGYSLECWQFSEPTRGPYQEVRQFQAPALDFYSRVAGPLLIELCHHSNLSLKPYVQLGSLKKKISPSDQWVILVAAHLQHSHFNKALGGKWSDGFVPSWCGSSVELISSGVQRVTANQKLEVLFHLQTETITASASLRTFMWFDCCNEKEHVSRPTAVKVQMLFKDPFPSSFEPF